MLVRHLSDNNVGTSNNNEFTTNMQLTKEE